MSDYEVLDPRFRDCFNRTAKVERLWTGARWTEGPVYFPLGRFLLFSDIPNDRILRYDECDGHVSVFRQPCGYANGHTVDRQGRLVTCEHGGRRVSRTEHDGRITVIAERFQGKRLNSPNDVVFDSLGNMYFTDPPYGLEGGVNDPKKELPFQGVYRVSKDGRISLLTKEMSRPNGLALSPDERTLYVANSDPQKPVWMAFRLDRQAGTVSGGKVFFDARALVDKGLKGLPDGLKVDVAGNLWATGPGGVLVIGPDGKHLGTLNTGEATSNVAWGEDGSVLYITADMYLCRIQTKARGKVPGVGR